MKAFFPLAITAMAFLPGTACAQSSSAFGTEQRIPEGAKWGAPFRFCNTIVVTLPDTPTTKQVAMALLDTRHTVASTNTELGIVQSGADPIQKAGLWRMIVNARIIGKTVELSGDMQAQAIGGVGGVVAGGNYSNTARYQFSGPPSIGFEMLDKVAKALGGRLHYEKR